MDTESSRGRSLELPSRLRDVFLPKGTRILMAEDDPISARILQAALSTFGYKPVVARDGAEAWEEFDREPFRMIVSDWMMPGLDGLKLCQKVRDRGDTAYTYFILLTGRETTAANYEVAGAAGVDDFLTKPLDREAIRIRLRVAERILKYTAEIRQLQQLIPICAYCHKVRDQDDFWDRVESYIQKQTGSTFSHVACPQCYEKELERLSLRPNEPQ
jgi:sigma-B regulation protein RsbU (phosphoserine phosphatase)